MPRKRRRALSRSSPSPLVAGIVFGRFVSVRARELSFIRQETLIYNQLFLRGKNISNSHKTNTIVKHLWFKFTAYSIWCKAMFVIDFSCVILGHWSKTNEMSPACVIWTSDEIRSFFQMLSWLAGSFWNFGSSAIRFDFFRSVLTNFVWKGRYKGHEKHTTFQGMQLSKTQWLTIVTTSAVNVFTASSVSIQAPFYPAEVIVNNSIFYYQVGVY